MVGVGSYDECQLPGHGPVRVKKCHSNHIQVYKLILTRSLTAMSIAWRIFRRRRLLAHPSTNANARLARGKKTMTLPIVLLRSKWTKIAEEEIYVMRYRQCARL